MTRESIRRTVAVLFFALLIVTLSAPSALAKKKLVFIVHSYEENHVCGQPQANGVLEALSDIGLYPAQVEVRQYYMDTKKTHTSAKAIAAQGRRVLQEVDAHTPDAVVTLDDNAFSTVGLALVDRPGVSVVFSGLNGQPEMYNAKTPFMDTRERPGRNVTGVYEKLHLKRALSVIKNTLPNAKKAVGITDTSPTGKALAKQFELESQEELPMQWEQLQVKTFEEYKKVLKSLNNDNSIDAIYPVALTLPTKDGGRVTAPEIFRYTLEHSTKPEVPLNYFFCKLGLFGGASVDFKSMGKNAGMLLAAILQGESAGNLKMVEAPDYAIVFNSARAKMLGVNIPEDILLAADAVFTTIPLLEQ